MTISRIAAALVLAGACLAQDVASRLDQIVQSYVSPDRQFMGSALVARGNEVLFSKGYGFANLEWEIPNTPTTKFRLASVSKQFAAASILLLEERGLLKVEDLVKKHLPDAPAAWDKVTIFHLLTHTSGIPNTGDFVGLSVKSTADNVARFRDKPLDFQPGEQYNYSNNGYILLGYLVEQISRRTYGRFLKDNIFTPLGMKDSGYDSDTEVITRRASGHSPDPLLGPQHATFIHVETGHAAGSLYSTTEDLLRWEQGLFGGKLLSAASLQKMTTPFKNNYAFGLGVSSPNGRKRISHNGAINGFNTMLAYYPDDKLTVVVLGNLSGPAPDQIANRLAALAHGETLTLLSERKEIKLDPAVLGRYVGLYRIAGGAEMLITLNNNQLFGKLGNQDELAMFPESETMFFLKQVDAQFEFPKLDAQGKASEPIRHQNDQHVMGARIDDAQAKRIADTAATLARRVKEQNAIPGSDAALRKMIEGWRLGQPDYDRLSPALASSVRQQLPQLQSALKQRGAVQSVSFKGVSPNGSDIYDVKFESGLWEYIIALGPDGKVTGGQLVGRQTE